MDQLRMFRLAVEAGSINFWHVAGAGWSVMLTTRRGDELWMDSQREVYSHLTTVELLDTIAAHLDSAL